jgi:hypothetical protein
MLRRRWFLLFGATAVLFLVLGSCKTEAGGPSPTDPPSGLTLPPVEDLPSLGEDGEDGEDVVFPTDKDEALYLAERGMGLAWGVVMESLDGIFDKFSEDFSGFTNSSYARAADSRDINEPIDYEASDAGAKVTGLIKGSLTTSFADTDFTAEDWSPSPGDFVEIKNLSADIEAVIDERSQGSLTVAGKFTAKGSAAGKVSFTNGDNPINITSNLSGDGGYALSVFDSDSKQSLKAVIKVSIIGGINKNIASPEELESLTDDIESLFSKFDFSITIYDNDGIQKFHEILDPNDLGNLM